MCLNFFKKQNFKKHGHQGKFNWDGLGFNLLACCYIHLSCPLSVHCIFQWDRENEWQACSQPLRGGCVMNWLNQAENWVIDKQAMGLDWKERQLATVDGWGEESRKEGTAGGGGMGAEVGCVPMCPSLVTCLVCFQSCWTRSWKAKWHRNPPLCS